MFSYSAWADCPKVGTTYTCVSGSTETQISNAIAAASDGDTIHINAGTYNWGNNGLTINTAESNLTIEGDGVGNTVVNSGGFYVYMTDNIRITGFEFNISNSVVVNSVNGYLEAAILFEGCHDFRFDHNEVDKDEWAAPLGGIYAIGDYATGKDSYGLIDNNTLINCRILSWGGWGGAPGSNDRWYDYGDSRGTKYNVFAEDNIVTVEAGTPGYPGYHCDEDGRVLCNFMDANVGGGYVARFNTITNSYFEHHPGSASNGRGTRNTEIYENTLALTATFIGGFSRQFYFHGAGSGVVFENHSSQNFNNPGIHLDYNPDNDTRRNQCLAGGNSLDGNENVGLYKGYPCLDQLGVNHDNTLMSGSTNPGQVKQPFYSWNNDQPNGELLWEPNRDGLFGVIYIEDRDFYATESSCTGTQTSGVCVGTWASRPTVCTEGVGYWATDMGEWNSNSAGNDGALYVCNDSNTYVLNYTPYTYPHPLRGEAEVVPANAIQGVTIN